MHALARAGTGVHVYVLDTGIRSTHAEFKYAVPEGSNGSAPPGTRVGNGFDAVDSSNSLEDCHGHGTHVSRRATRPPRASCIALIFKRVCDLSVYCCRFAGSRHRGRPDVRRCQECDAPPCEGKGT